jgi:hypothetical protein
MVFYPVAVEVEQLSFVGNRYIGFYIHGFIMILILIFTISTRFNLISEEAAR